MPEFDPYSFKKSTIAPVAAAKTGVVHRMPNIHGGRSMCGQFRAKAAELKPASSITCKTCKGVKLTRVLMLQLSTAIQPTDLMIEADQAEGAGLQIAGGILRALAQIIAGELKEPWVDPSGSTGKQRRIASGL